MDRRIRRVRSVLDEQYRDPPSVHELAAMVGLSSSRLAHLFREEVSMSIRSYVVARRLYMAALLIKQTDERISQIAYGVGFNDVSNFNHAFKKAFSCSPMAIRQPKKDRLHKAVKSPENPNRTARIP